VAKVLNILLQKVRRSGMPSVQEIEWQALHEAQKNPANNLVSRLRDRALERGYTAAWLSS